MAKLFASQKRLSPKAENGLLAAVHRMSPAASRGKRPAPLHSPEGGLRKQSFHSPPRALPDGDVSPDQSDSDDFHPKQDDALSSSVDTRSDQGDPGDSSAQAKRWRPSEIAWDSGESSDAPEDPEVIRSPMQQRLAQVLDEAISVASEATSVDTGLPGHNDADTEDSECYADINSEDGLLSLEERALAEKYKPVLSRLHEDLDMLVLRYPSVGEGVTTLLRQLVNGLNSRRHSDHLETELQGPLTQCSASVGRIIEGRSQAPSAQSHVAFSPERCISEEQSSERREVQEDQSRLKKEYNNQSVSSMKAYHIHAKPEYEHREGRCYAEDKFQSWPWSPAPPRQHSNVGPEAEPSPCGRAHVDHCSEENVHPRLLLLPEAVASAEVQCRTSVQKKLLQIVSQEITKHFGDLYERLRMELPRSAWQPDSEASCVTPAGSSNGCNA